MMPPPPTHVSFDDAWVIIAPKMILRTARQTHLSEVFCTLRSIRETYLWWQKG